MKLGIKFVFALCLMAASTAFADHHEGHDKMWDKVDTNKDGFISKEEFMMKKQEHFNKADKNSDGKIDPKEHEDMMKDKMEKMDD